MINTSARRHSRSMYAIFGYNIERTGIPRIQAPPTASTVSAAMIAASRPIVPANSGSAFRSHCSESFVIYGRMTKPATRLMTLA